MIVVALIAILSSQPQTPCADVASCRSMALAAQQSRDYEAFHDLAWAAYRKGKNNDPELMLLVARAQSLSGRPLDALVMLERIAAAGGHTDAATSEDFARVRALPRWSDVAPKLGIADPPPSPPVSAPPAKAPPSAAAAPSANPSKTPATSPPTPSPGSKTPAPSPASTAKAPAPPPAPEPATTAAAPKAAPAPDPAASAPAAPAKAPARAPREPLSFTTVLTPSAVAHDAVSQRFLIADRKAKRIAVVDANTGQVATLVGAQGALGEIGGMAIDPREGDLWVVSTTAEGSALHRVQLISGRILSTVPLKLERPVTAMAWTRGSGLIVADQGGVIWRVRTDGNVNRLGALEYVPLGLGTDASGRLYVAAGTPRLARFSVGTTLRRIDTVEIDPEIPAAAPFVVLGNRLNFVVPADGTFTIRSVVLK